MESKKKNIVEVISYVIVGVLTTAVNFIVYFASTFMHIHWFFANMIAWIFAVLFAYFANRRFVFMQSDNDVKTEFMQFCSLRLVTLGLETILMFICIQMLHINENLAKIAVSFLTVIGNYVFCKFLIFKPKNLNTEL